MQSNFEIALGTAPQIWAILCIILLIVCVLNLIINEDTSPQVVVMVGLALIGISVGALWSVEEMKSWVGILQTKQLVSDAFAAEFRKRTNVFLYVLPFVTAAIGTNLISDVYTKKLHYNEKTTLLDVIKFIPEVLKIVLGFCILVPIAILIIAPISMAFGMYRRRRPRAEIVLQEYYRKSELLLLKLDILYRDIKERKESSKKRGK